MEIVIEWEADDILIHILSRVRLPQCRLRWGRSIARVAFIVPDNSLLVGLWKPFCRVLKKCLRSGGEIRNWVVPFLFRSVNTRCRNVFFFFESLYGGNNTAIVGLFDVKYQCVSEYYLCVWQFFVLACVFRDVFRLSCPWVADVFFLFHNQNVLWTFSFFGETFTQKFKSQRFP